MGRSLIVDPPAAEVGPDLVAASLDCETNLGQVTVAGEEVQVGENQRLVRVGVIVNPNLLDLRGCAWS